VTPRPGKSDEIDALAIARAVVKDGVKDFPAAHLDEHAMEIRLLSDHRKDLVAERTRIQNRFRWHLLELCGELEQSLRNAGRSWTASTGVCGACPPALACASHASRSRICASSLARSMRWSASCSSSSRRTARSCSPNAAAAR
jgi:transposase